MKSVTVFERISRISLYLIAGAIPLWFLPVVQSSVDYQKQSLLVVLALVGVISLLAKMVYAGKIELRSTWLHIPVFGIIAAVGISTIFSAWRYGSFWGRPLDATDNFLTFFAFALFYILISQGVENKKYLLRTFKIFVTSGFVAVVLALLQLKEIFILPFVHTHSNFFTTLGSGSSVALFAAILLPISIMIGSAHKKVEKGLFFAIAILLFFSLMLFDFFSAWVVAIVGLAILFAFEAVQMQKQNSAKSTEWKPGRISLPMILSLAALFFVVIGGFTIPGAPERPAEVSPNYKGEFAVLTGVIADNPLTGVVGTGPGTFVLDYTKHRLIDLNKTIFWSTRFESGVAEILDWVITKGTLGLLALGGAIFTAVFLLLQAAMRKEESAKKTGTMVGLIAGLVGITISMFLYPANFVLWFMFWMLLGAAGYMLGKKTKVSLLEGSSFFALGSSVGLMLIVVLGVALVFIGGQKYVAEIQYAQGIQAANQGNITTGIEKLKNASRLNSSVDIYWRDLAQLYLQYANMLAVNQALDASQKQQEVGIAITKAVDASKEAVVAGPKSAANWSVQGYIYRNLIGAVDRADQFAVLAYTRASELEPASPFAWTELGRVKVIGIQQGLSPDRTDSKGNDYSIKGAIADLEQAIQLKNDYAPAHYLVAIAYGLQGNETEAITKLEETKLVAPNDVGLAFQLGVIYYRQEELGKARDEFERAKRINVRYANARYMLGLTYDKLGRKADATAEFAAVAALNPDNQEVRDILANLTAGLPALSGLGSQAAQPPIEDNPPEIGAEE